jgi:hypothetical protein
MLITEHGENKMAQDDLLWRTAYDTYLGSTKETWSEFDLGPELGPQWPAQCAAPCFQCSVSDVPEPKE